MSTLKPRTASLVIYQGDDLAHLSELHQAAQAAERAAKGVPLRQGDEIPGKAEKDAYNAAVEEAATRALVVEVRAIGRKRFAELVAEHSPRTTAVTVTSDDGSTRTVQEPHPDDAAFDVNVTTFGDALLSFVDGEVRTIVAPTFPTGAALREFLDDELSEGDFRDLWITAYQLNRAPAADPKAHRYSTDSPRSSQS